MVTLVPGFAFSKAAAIAFSESDSEFVPQKEKVMSPFSSPPPVVGGGLTAGGTTGGEQEGGQPGSDREQAAVEELHEGSFV